MTSDEKRNICDKRSRELFDLLNDVDELDWLKRFAAYELNDNQRTALVFLREVGAIDAVAYRQLTGCSPKLVAKELSGIKDQGLMIQKGRARGTYYVPAEMLLEGIKKENSGLTSQASAVTTTPRAVMSTAQGVMMTPLAVMSTAQDVMMTPRQGEIPDVLQKKIAALKRRVPSKVMQSVIVELCAVRAMERIELSKILKRSAVTIDRLIAPLIGKELDYLYPMMVHHPRQAYVASGKRKEAT